MIARICPFGISSSSGPGLPASPRRLPPRQRDLDYQVLEQGVLVNSIYRFPPQMVFFTTPELLEIGGLPFVSPYEKPTRAEALQLLPQSGREVRPADFVWRDGAVGASARTTVSRVETRTSRGVRRARHAQNVLLAIGYYDHPNLIGVPGEDLPHVHHYYSEPHAYFRQRVVIVGGGNSAAEAALECFRAGAHVTLVHRRPELKSTIKYWVKPDIENRIKEGSVAARFNTCVTEIKPTSVLVRTAGSDQGRRAAGGCRPPADGLPLRLEPAARRRCPPQRALCADAQSETFETNVPGLFLAGGAVTGMDTSNIFIENGRFHGEKIVQVIARSGSRLRTQGSGRHKA